MSDIQHVQYTPSSQPVPGNSQIQSLPVSGLSVPASNLSLDTLAAIQLVQYSYSQDINLTTVCPGSSDCSEDTSQTGVNFPCTSDLHLKQELNANQHLSVENVHDVSSKIQIFSSLIATISEQVLSLIPGSKEGFLQEAINEDRLVLLSDIDNGHYFVSGSLQNILKMGRRLLSLVGGEPCDLDFLSCGDSNSFTEQKHSVGKVDVSITCDLSRGSGVAIATENMFEPIKKSVTSTGCQTESYKGIHLKMETEMVPEPVITSHGRKVKQPSRLSGYINSSTLDNSVDYEPEYDHFSDDDNDDNDIDDTFKRKRKRKVGRPRKLLPQMETNKIMDNFYQKHANNIADSGSAGNLFSQQDILQGNNNLLASSDVNVVGDGIEAKENNGGILGMNSVKSAENDATDNEKLLEKKMSKKNYEDAMPYKYFCQDCSFKSKRESHFIKHRALHEGNPEIFKCTKCDFRTLRRSVLKKHDFQHTTAVYSCTECSYKTTDEALLVKHARVKHMVDEEGNIQDPKAFTSPRPLYFCEACHYKTRSMPRYSNHLQMHRGFENMNGELGFHCDECPYKTSRKEHLIRHKSNVHSNRRPYLCDLCGMAFKRPDALSAHKLTHIAKSERPYPVQCVHCKKGFRSQANLKEHMSVHTSTRSHLCDICGAAFKTRAVQKKHLQTIHYNPRSFPCDSCTKRFNTKCALQRHQRTHEEVAVIPPEALEPTPPSMEATVTNIQEMSQEQLSQLAVQTLQNVSDTGESFVQDVMEASIEEYEGSDGQSYIQPNETTTALLYLTGMQSSVDVDNL